jgi:hypothetical protein
MYSFPLNNGAGGRYVAPWRPAGQEEPWLSPEDDPDAKRGIPIFRPTLEEFKVSLRLPRLWTKLIARTLKATLRKPFHGVSTLE